MATENIEPEDLYALSGLNQKDRIQILLGEYTALRTEIMARTGFGFQLIAIGGAVATWLIKNILQDPAMWFWIGVTSAFLLFLLVGAFVNVRDLTRAAHRVKDLEHEINSRAGEHLLVWESLSGVLTRMNIVKSFFVNIVPFSRAELRPLDPSYIQKEKDARRRSADRV